MSRKSSTHNSNRFKVDLLAASGRECPYCGNIMRVRPGKKQKVMCEIDFPTRDHVIPKSKLPGQPVVIVCRKCNSDKSNRDLQEWLDLLKNTNDIRCRRVSELINKPLIRSLFHSR